MNYDNKLIARNIYKLRNEFHNLTMRPADVWTWKHVEHYLDLLGDYFNKLPNTPTTVVSKIIAGSNITISPVEGTGDVTINADGGTVTIRTVDEFIASEGQTDFVINVAFDFFDVYLNGARLIESEYTLVVNTVSLVSPAEADDEIIIISYKDTGLAQLPKDYDVLHDFVTPYSYIGKALADTSISVNAWNIKRIEILEDGSTVVTTATNVNWTNRYTHTYS